jgi:hypothetical protein
MAYSLSPWPRVRFEDENGNPLAGGKLYTSLNNTETRKRPIPTLTERLIQTLSSWMLKVTPTSGSTAITRIDSN